MNPRERSRSPRRADVVKVTYQNTPLWVPREYKEAATLAFSNIKGRMPNTIDGLRLFLEHFSQGASEISEQVGAFFVGATLEQMSNFHNREPGKTYAIKAASEHALVVHVKKMVDNYTKQISNDAKLTPAEKKQLRDMPGGTKDIDVLGEVITIPAIYEDDMKKLMRNFANIINDGRGGSIQVDYFEFIADMIKKEDELYKSELWILSNRTPTPTLVDTLHLVASAWKIRAIRSTTDLYITDERMEIAKNLLYAKHKGNVDLILNEISNVVGEKVCPSKHCAENNKTNEGDVACGILMNTVKGKKVVKSGSCCVGLDAYKRTALEWGRDPFTNTQLTREGLIQKLFDEACTLEGVSDSDEDPIILSSNVNEGFSFQQKRDGRSTPKKRPRSLKKRESKKRVKRKSNSRRKKTLSRRRYRRN